MLQIPSVPQNLQYNGSAMTLVDSDVYNICERIRELSPRLIVRLRDGASKPWVVMELCDDGVERLVASYEALDQRILDDLRYMLAVPFEKRLEEADKRVEKHNAELQNPMGMNSEKFDKFAYDFQKALVDSNMVNPKWSKNMPLNKKG